MTAKGRSGIRQFSGAAGGSICGTDKWANGLARGIGGADGYVS